MARTAEDCARMLEVLAGSDGLDPRQYDVRTAKYTESLSEDLTGIRIGILREGFGIAGVSESDVDAAVKEAISVLEKVGARATEVSVPMHNDGLALWSAIAFEGATELMVRGDGYGTNWRGHYSTQLMDFYGRARRARGHDFSDTVKMTVLAGHYMSEQYNRHYYGKAQNIGRRLARDYDKALQEYDLLIMPTTAMKAVKRPADKSLNSTLAGALSNLHNTAPFDVSGHPAMSVPVGFSEGLPVGMQLVGRRWDEATVLKVAHAYQVAIG
jgi:amidase|tara:strand:- start:115 stop:924 length:810 start_codon:yes stop_codon:yes gene_type:complete